MSIHPFSRVGAVCRPVLFSFLLMSPTVQAQWVHVTDDLPNFPMRSVDFVNQNLGLAVGARAILRSTDGGRTWAVSDTSTFSGYFDSTIAGIVSIVVGSQMAIGRSSDGGSTWRLVHTGNPITLNEACFRGHGVYSSFGEGAWLAESIDYGLSWTTGLVFPSADMDVGICQPDGTIWAGGFWNDAGSNQCCGVLMRSVDGADSWTVAIRPDNANDGRFIDVQFVSDSAGFALSTDFRFLGGRSLVWKTTDGGRLWEHIATGPLSRAMLFWDEDNGLLGGLQGALRLTRDGGKSWEADTLFPPLDVYDFELLEDAVIAVGDGGVYRNESLVSLAFERDRLETPNLDVDLYPNPASTTMRMTLNRSLVAGRPVRVDLLDVLGRAVGTVEWDQRATSQAIDIADLPPGVYFYRLDAGHDRASGTFVIVR
jgi:photosystem II stability/assembly factor-like uncharacterized protein